MEDYFKKIIELFVRSDVSTSSQNEFYRWLTGDKFSLEKEKALRGLWDAMPENKPAEVSPETQQSLKDVYKKIERCQRKTGIRPLRFWQISAACLLVALISTFYIVSNSTPANIDLIELYVPTAEITHLTLPDGTQVQMNSNATLLYPEQFTGESRSVYLIGEANFKVAKNEKQPFIVKSNDFQVTALGTEFNMQVYPNDSILSTTLLKGSVEVRFNNLATAQVLKPSEQLTYNKYTKKETISHPNIEDVTAWQRGELVFRSVTLKEIFTVLERKYPYTFVYSLNTLKDDKYMFCFKNKTSLQ
ncbi:MAG: FecR domain-containing protein, partial [Proteiniphilum sp.]|nr:FecR domain-containing protein [Proteiniphilum sp.]